MDKWLNQFLEATNEFMVKKPGILPMVGLLFIVLNLVLQIFPGPGRWLTDSNLFLHIGLLISLIGLLLVSAYRH